MVSSFATVLYFYNGVRHKFFNDEEKKYYKRKYNELNRKYDSAALFTLKAFDLLNQNGLLGFISTQTWQTGENYTDYRKTILTKSFSYFR